MTQPNEERLRIRGYLQAQAAKLAVPELIEKVRADSARLRDAAAAAQGIDNLKRPAEEDWSVNEVLSHVHDSCRGINAGIIGAALRGERPGPVADSLAKANQARPPLTWFETIATERETMFSTLAGADEQSHLGIAWHHPFFGDLNWREWLLFLRIHDLDHARQIASTVEALKTS